MLLLTLMAGAEHGPQKKCPEIRGGEGAESLDIFVGRVDCQIQRGNSPTQAKVCDGVSEDWTQVGHKRNERQTF